MNAVEGFRKATGRSFLPEPSETMPEIDRDESCHRLHEQIARMHVGNGRNRRGSGVAQEGTGMTVHAQMH